VIEAPVFGYEVFIGFKKAKIEFFNAFLLHKNCGTQSGEEKIHLGRRGVYYEILPVMPHQKVTSPLLWAF
jgi:hypothetical protein